jgi:hypothetical protein
METVDDILSKSSGISREKYIETLVGCIDARHAAKTEPKLLSRQVRFARDFLFHSHAIRQLLGSVR